MQYQPSTRLDNCWYEQSRELIMQTPSQSNQTHRIYPSSEIFCRDSVLGQALYTSSRSGRNYFELNNEAYSSRIIHFPKGNVIKRHCHSRGPIFKILLCGQIKYEKDELLNPGEVAVVESRVFYEGLTLEDSMLLLIEPKETQTITD